MVSLSFSLDNLAKFIANEADRIYGMKYQMRSLSNKLRLIRSYIQNSGSTPEQNSMEREVINQIRRITYEAEDLISEYTTLARHKKKNILGLTFYPRTRQASWRIDKLNKEIEEILANKETYARPVDPGTESDLAGLDFHVNDVVDFVDDMAKLVNLLMENDGVSRLHVISIVGMGGSGKTALARKLFDDDRVKEHFSFRLWVDNNQGDTSSDILRQIVRKLGIRDVNDSLLQTMNDGILKEIVEKHLDQKYLIVMDNLWETRAWDRVKRAFPDSSNGSRIVITSRQLQIVHYTNSSAYHVPHLADSDSRELFCKKAFENDQFPNNLESVVQQVVRSCHGLPLTLLILGRLLAEQEREEQTWSTFLGNPYSYPDEGRSYWRETLATSYDQLKKYENLKLCFFYLGVFPANYEIPVRQLIQLWIAEELIPENGDKSLENIAETYLNELIDGCLVQPTSFRLDRRVKTCRVHSVLRDLCVWESRKDDFLEVRMDSSSTSRSKPRRLSVHFNLLDFVSVSSRYYDCSSTRSFLCFAQQSYLIDNNAWTWLYEKIQVIRVLNLENVQIELVPEDIGKLIHLKYLKLKGKKLQVLPESIGKLWNLVTLDLRGSAVNCLPRKIWKLENLMHLCLSQPTKLLDTPSESSGKFGSLPSLQAISNIILDQESLHLITKARFPLVTKLGLYVNNRNTKNEKSSQEEILFDVLANVCCLSSLKRLKIGAPLSENLGLQNSLCQLKVTKVTLVKCKINNNDFHVLGKLPELRYLKLVEVNFDGNNLQCDPGSFAQLDGFQMTHFQIQNWTISEGAMPNLRHLIIKHCQEIRELPDRRHLASLKELRVHCPCSSELTATLQRMKSKMGDWCNIQIFY